MLYLQKDEKSGFVHASFDTRIIMNSKKIDWPLSPNKGLPRATWGITLILILLVSQVTAANAQQAYSCKECTYSNAASAFCPNQGITAKKEFPSPDGLKKIIVKVKPMDQPKLYVSIAGHEYLVEFSPWPCPEFEWSHDSKAFFVTYSDGGSVGNFKVKVYYPSEEGLEMIEATSAIQNDFLDHYPKCFEPETPNIAGIAWVKDSELLLIAAEVLPHSNCDMMGTFAAYEIEVPSGKIIKKYAQLDAKKRFWRLLGPELRAADDNCFTNPGFCEIPMLHGK